MKTLDMKNLPNVGYCISNELRDEQIKINISKVKERFTTTAEDFRMKEPIAIVCFGPSLKNTWKSIKAFNYIITCSGAHKFLLEKGIKPEDFKKWYHCLHASSIVDTDIGPKTIKWIVENKYTGKVLSFNEATKVFEWRKVINHSSTSSRKSSKKWVRIKFSSVGNKKKLVCTEDHAILVVDNPLDTITAPYYIEASKSLGKYSLRRVDTAIRNHNCNPLYNPEQIAIMVGIMLGDGHIREDGCFCITHGEPQRKYNELIASIFGGSVRTSYGVAFGKKNKRNVLDCKINDQTKLLRDMFYPSGEKKTIKNILHLLDEKSLAFWYMDDGSLRVRKKRPNYGTLFCTDGFSLEDVKLLVDWFFKKWGIIAKISIDGKKYNRISICSSESKKLFKIIAPYIPESMKDKIPWQFRNVTKHIFNNKPETYCASKITEVYYPVVKKGKWHGGRFYDIQVDGLRNFVANQMVVHNCDLDPREHKIKLIGEPQKDIEYLPASTVHPKYIDYLRENGAENIKLWHIFANENEGRAVLPRGESLVTGGSSVGLRCLTLSRLMGFTDFHIFGMDGSIEDGETHTTEHPNAPPEKGRQITEVNGKQFVTTASMAFCAHETMKELDLLPDVRFKF